MVGESSGTMGRLIHPAVDSEAVSVGSDVDAAVSLTSGVSEGILSMAVSSGDVVSMGAGVEVCTGAAQAEMVIKITRDSSVYFVNVEFFIYKPLYE